jgi:PAS domain S-box-containing protein
MMGEVDEHRKRVLREILSQLHSGVSPQEVKERFKQFLEGVSAEEIARIEQELVKEGLPREEIQRLCDVHLAVFKEQLEKQRPVAKQETPINILLEEHKILQQISEKLGQVADKIVKAEDAKRMSSEISQLREIATELLDAEKHYLREENVLFPLLEKHGITEPPAIMWMEHNQLREKKKKLREIMENYSALNFQDFRKQLGEVSKSIIDVLSSHIFKENNILFPTALRVVTEQEWRDAQKDFDEIGYCCFTPQHLITAPETKEEIEKPKAEVAPMPEGLLQFETGTLSKEEVEALLDTLPVDITFVDANDTVKYFNKAEKRIFVRTKAVIGRKVQLCHPQKSIHIVNRILEAFRKGEKDVAEFWIQMNNRLIHIRYFAVRDKNGKYLGTMEVTQDLTDIKKIEGEKRLLDWKG